MTAALSFVTYLWHYLVARLLYDQLIWPLIHGRRSTLLVVCVIAVLAFVAGRWTRSSTSRWTRRNARRTAPPGGGDPRRPA